MEYGSDPLWQIAVVGGVISFLAIFATTVRLAWRRNKKVNQR